MWTPEKEKLLRDEIEKLFRLRTPAKDIMDVEGPGSTERDHIHCN